MSPTSPSKRPENNPGWRTKWFYAKDKSSDGETFGLEEFQTTSVL
jgi:hypothetical protein